MLISYLPRTKNVNVDCSLHIIYNKVRDRAATLSQAVRGLPVLYLFNFLLYPKDFRSYSFLTIFSPFF